MVSAAVPFESVRVFPERLICCASVLSRYGVRLIFVVEPSSSVKSREFIFSTIPVVVSRFFTSIVVVLFCSSKYEKVPSPLSVIVVSVWIAEIVQD